MRLLVKDQIGVSAVQADSLRPGQIVEVSDAMGGELMTKHPAKFEQLPDLEPAEKAAPTPDNKAEPEPLNKAAAPAKAKAPRAPKTPKAKG